MPRKEANGADQYVASMLRNIGISDNENHYQQPAPEVAKALRGASKQGHGGNGVPDFAPMINGFLIFIEDKKSPRKLFKRSDKDGHLLMDEKAINNFAVNGAVHYAKYALAHSSNYDKIFAIGFAGDETNYQMSGYFISKDGKEVWLNPKSIDKFKVFNSKYIDDFYRGDVLGMPTHFAVKKNELKNIASKLHNEMRSIGELTGPSQSVIVAEIVLAIQSNDLNLADLKGKTTGAKQYLTKQDKKEHNENPLFAHSIKAEDGYKIYLAASELLDNADLGKGDKTTVIKNQFYTIVGNEHLSTPDPKHIDKYTSPLKLFVETIQKAIAVTKQMKNSIDMLGNFFEEFVKYGGSDSNSLGIVLTPTHITQLMSRMIDIKPSDYVLDPTAGTASFLIASMSRMLNIVRGPSYDGNVTERDIKRNHLYGIEKAHQIYPIAAVNMMLRGDGKSHLIYGDMFKETAKTIQAKGPISKILMNPPYSQAKVDKSLSEMHFVEHALTFATAPLSKAAFIVPQQALVYRKFDYSYRKNIMKHNRLNAVITMNDNTFGDIDTNPAIMIFTPNEPQDNHLVKFINFRNDGYHMSKHLGLVEGGLVGAKEDQLLKVLNDDTTEQIPASYMIKHTIKPDEDWLHDGYWADSSTPKDNNFMSSIAGFLSFKFNMLAHGRKYMFRLHHTQIKSNANKINLNKVQFHLFSFNNLFHIDNGYFNRAPKMLDKSDSTFGEVDKASGAMLPFLSAKKVGYGLRGFTSYNIVKNSKKSGTTKHPTLNGKLFSGNSIAFTNNGSLGHAYYIPCPYSASHDVTNITFKNHTMNSNLAMFVITMIRQTAHSFSYARKMRPKRLTYPYTKIYLPAKVVNGEIIPDYNLMEQYIEQLKKSFGNLI